MLKKCLRYDLLDMWHFWWILAASTLGMSIVCGLACRAMVELFGDADKVDQNALLVLPLTLIICICILGIIASVTVTVILVMVRFYKHFFSDEGYLTFTLPVKRSTLFTSKVINAIIWYSAHIVLLIISVLIILAIAVPASAWASFFGGIVAVTDVTFLSVVITIIKVLEFIILGVLAMVLEILLMYLCITIGSVAVKKGKIFVGIGIYYGINAVFGFVMQLSMGVLGIFLWDGASEILASAPVWQSSLADVLALALVCVAIAVPVCVLYLVTVNLIERKLNLN
ncbi:MAG: hypothetical protein E7653_07600 [Ruminococcaceae bacterium]|nr:hypothetical protein [Oscillospiraceae bacterium]